MYGTLIYFIVIVLLSTFLALRIHVVSVLFVFALRITYNVTLAVAVTIYVPEILPDTGIALTTCVLWIAELIVTFLFPVLANPLILNIHGVFFTFSGITFAAFVFFYFFVVESKGKTKSEV